MRYVSCHKLPHALVLDKKTDAVSPKKHNEAWEPPSNFFKKVLVLWIPLIK